MRLVTLHTGPDTHLDHLGVLSILLDVPLLVTADSSLKAAQVYYPQLSTSLVDHASLSLDFLASNFDVILESGHRWASELLPLFELFSHKKMRIIYCPHGYSDKKEGDKYPKDLSFAYGEQKKTAVRTGNYRYPFYRQHRTFYDRQLEEKIAPHLDKGKKTLLYAPTWLDRENPLPLFEICEEVVAQLGGQFNLVVKLHPLLEEYHPAWFYYFEERCLSLPGVFSPGPYPPIYPLLNFVDGYLGDFSSIGYDFLLFEKPMFFFHPSPLSVCGHVIPTLNDLASFLHTHWDQRELTMIRKKMYHHAFGEERSAEELRRDLEILLRTE